MNENEPRVGDVIAGHEWVGDGPAAEVAQDVGVVLKVIYPQGTGDRGRVVFHWMKNDRGTFDVHPLSWVRNALASGHMKLISRAESVNSENL